MSDKKSFAPFSDISDEPLKDVKKLMYDVTGFMNGCVKEIRKASLANDKDRSIELKVALCLLADCTINIISNLEKDKAYQHFRELNEKHLQESYGEDMQKLMIVHTGEEARKAMGWDKNERGR